MAERHDGRGEVLFICDSCQEGIVGLVIDGEGNHYCVSCCA